ncbi:hypothetical protein GF319_07135 [Candidatus Bathyarchaeota archaeon]|nr:hypothetical protein [Candidatus Bathyarchaeota archaeon]
MDTIKSLIEENRTQIKRLTDGALVHLGYYDFDVSVTNRKGVDIFDPDAALYSLKVDTSKPLSEEDISFINKNLINSKYTVKRIYQEGNRLLLLI